MRVGLVAVLLVGCAPRQPKLDVVIAQSAAEPPPIVDTDRPIRRTVVAPRPEVDIAQVLPDFHDELRWPLTAMSHPSLEPRFGVAAVFAEPDVGWLDLCKRGVHKRTVSGRNRDELAYLNGWCSAASGDAETACGNLTQLTRSAVLGMSAAVRVDLANIIADAGHIDKAEHLLQKYSIDDPEILDTLAATYIELGRDRDAFEINRRAIDVDARASHDAQCRRLIKQIVLSPQGERPLPVEQLTNLAAKPKVPDPTCIRLLHAWQCAENPRQSCASYLQDIGADLTWTYVLDAYYDWPKGDAPVVRWLQIAEVASFAVLLPAGMELMLASLEAAARVPGGCTGATYQKAVDLKKWMDLSSIAVPKRLTAVREQCGGPP